MHSITAKLFDHELLEKHPVGLVSKEFTWGKSVSWFDRDFTKTAFVKVISELIAT